MSPPLVRCQACTRTWHSHTMADGLRTLGVCPRCGGTLIWTEAAPEPDAAVPARVTPAESVAPHLVLGVPRR
ncbi:MAG: hypothetical protein JWO02_3619 [Solirubrobacterales bacterium]|nr:hypothetical protein [Solirubrobacterales bacterium]